MLQTSNNICNVTDKWIAKEIYTWSLALGPSVLKRIGMQRLSSYPHSSSLNFGSGQ